MAVTPETIAVALGRTAPDPGTPEFAQWEMWIADAALLIEARLGDLNELDQAKLDYVVREAVVAHVRRPDDVTQVAISADDGNVSRTYRSSKGRVVILDEWWDLLSPKNADGAFSITPQPTSGGHAPWCDLMYPFRGDTCSCGYSLTGGPWIYEPAEWP